MNTILPGLLKRCGVAVAALALVAALAMAASRSADTLPERLSDEAFRQMVAAFSENGGDFPYDNLMSNEASYQSVIPELKRVAMPEGVYLGVGPEQNFTYIAALKPKIAFVVDIRRQNMLELLLYKALFELSSNRADFVSKLFSRPRPAGLDEDSTARSLFEAFKIATADPGIFAETLGNVKNLMLDRRGFPLTMDDQETIAHILETFMRGGPSMDYGFRTSSQKLALPTYADLMTATDFQGRSWSYLATEENFQAVRSMQQRNLIVPLVGDFAGSKALRMVARYLRSHGATLTAFYVSNVEQYIIGDKLKWSGFMTNVVSMPLDASSTFIRFVPPASTTLAPIMEFKSRTPANLWHLLRGGYFFSFSPSHS